MGMRNVEVTHSIPFPCSCCNNTDADGQWWSLRDYFGVWGRFCPVCYDKVRHTAYGQPYQPEQYRAILVQQQLERTR